VRPLDPSASSSLLERHRHDEGARWSRFLVRALAVTVVVGAFVEVFEVGRDPTAWLAAAFPRVLCLGAVACFAILERSAAVDSIGHIDRRARATMWSFALFSAYSAGATGRVPLTLALVAVVAAFLPASMRRLTALRWSVGATVWMGIALGVSVATRGQGTFTTPILMGISAGPALFLAVFAIGRVASTEQREIAADLELGALGKYELVRCLGSGGMGEVWEAHHPALKISVALKLLRIQNKVARGRFEAEARTTARLSHPNTVRIYDYGIVGEGLAYYVMEYVPGKNLRSLVATEGPLSARRAVNVARQIANALNEAHQLGLVHRDIKPENVILCSAGGQSDSVKIIDFGLVFQIATSNDSERFTSPGTIVGTPSYIAPEAAFGGDATPASDVYSLGCVLYFLLTGRPPFTGESPQDVLAAHVKDPVVLPSRRAPGISADVDAFVLSCLNKEPAERPQTGRELLEAIEACAGHREAEKFESQLAELPSLVGEGDRDSLSSGVGSLFPKFDSLD